MTPVYTEVKWRKGSIFKADAKAALKEIEALNKRHGGFAPDGSLVEHARNPKSVLHNEFEWDDEVASNKFRLITEKNIKRSLVVVTETKKELEAFTNKYKSLTELSDVLEPINLFLKK